MNILITWVGRTDLRAVEQSDEIGLGPIAQALVKRPFDQVVMLYDYPAAEVESYKTWLAQHTSADLVLQHRPLTGPTNFGEIYLAATEVIEASVAGSTDAKLSYHLSPGTPAMAAVWILIAKTRFPATLIESSRQHGVREAIVPFDIAVDFLPDLLKGPDRRIEELTRGLPPNAPSFNAIIHQSQVMQRVIARARRVSLRSVPVLIEGESGTGKELLARAIHHAGPRKDKPFIAVNCGAIAPELVESELFGHEKGAFTGASAGRKGHFESANGGTLFLDEIGDLPLPIQVKLLRVLQEGEVTRVGSSQPIKVDVRIVAATHCTLSDEIATGRFREDLFYRLAVAILKLPPLRQRAGDVGLLIDALLEQVNEDAKDDPGYNRKILSVTARELLLEHPWPGNVRELLNTLTRAALWSGERITADDVRDALLPPRPVASAAILGREIGDGLDIDAILDRVSRHYIERALEETGGVKAKAASLLGLNSATTLSNRMKKMGL